jgi:acyl carrier protein
MASVSNRVLDIVCGQLEVTRDRLNPETRFIDDLGADSLDTVELVMEFENEFDVTIPEEDAERIQSVGEAVKYIEEKLAAS